MQAMGQHCLFDAYGIDCVWARDAQQIEALLKRAALAADATILGSHFHTFGGEGGVMSVFGMQIPMPGMQDGIDEDTLRQVAATTGGQFFRARDTQSLAGIYAEIDRLEPVRREGAAVRPRIELYWTWLLAALAVAALSAALSWWRMRR